MIGAVFSKQDLTFNGSGTLSVTSPADHGIVCKDDLVFTSGTYTVNSASHGLDANDSVRITNADISIAAGGTDSSGMGGRDNGIFGGSEHGMGGRAGTKSSSASTSHNMSLLCVRRGGRDMVEITNSVPHALSLIHI